MFFPSASICSAIQHMVHLEVNNTWLHMRTFFELSRIKIIFCVPAARHSFAKLHKHYIVVISFDVTVYVHMNVCMREISDSL